MGHGQANAVMSGPQTVPPTPSPIQSTRWTSPVRRQPPNPQCHVQTAVACAAGMPCEKSRGMPCHRPFILNRAHGLQVLSPAGYRPPSQAPPWLSSGVPYLCGVKPAAKPAPKLPNLVPVQPVQPNLLLRLQPSLSPSLQLESPFVWPPLSVSNSSKSNTRARKSGTQGLSLSRAEHASQQAVSASFCGLYALMFACLASCHASFVFPRGGGGRQFGFVPRGCGDTIMHRRLIKGVGGVAAGQSNTNIWFVATLRISQTEQRFSELIPPPADDLTGQHGVPHRTSASGSIKTGGGHTPIPSPPPLSAMPLRLLSADAAVHVCPLSSVPMIANRCKRRFGGGGGRFLSLDPPPFAPKGRVLMLANGCSAPRPTWRVPHPPSSPFPTACCLGLWPAPNGLTT